MCETRAAKQVYVTHGQCHAATCLTDFRNFSIVRFDLDMCRPKDYLSHPKSRFLSIAFRSVVP